MQLGKRHVYLFPDIDKFSSQCFDILHLLPGYDISLYCVMSVLPESFGILTRIGLWRPIGYRGWKAMLYYLYTVLLFFNNITFILSEAIDLIFLSDGVFDFLTNSSMFITTIGACGKIITILWNRGTIIKLTESLNEFPFAPRNEGEAAIRNEFNRIIRTNTLCYEVYFETSVICYTIGKILEDRPIGELPCRAWFPFDYSTPVIYWIITAQQLMTIVMSCNVDIGFDTLMPGIMLQICSQVRILKHRYQSMLMTLEKTHSGQESAKISYNTERKLFGDCVEYHIEILRMTETVNTVFYEMIFIQYSCSSIILCTSVYAFSQMKPFSPEFIACLGYILCMFIQIFVLCIAGHRVTLEFADLGDTMYDTNWFLLSNNARRYMMMMMIKSSRPIEFVSGYLISLSLESFKRLIKLSYTIYSVLKS